jgi:hypothetical protein
MTRRAATGLLTLAAALLVAGDLRVAGAQEPAAMIGGASIDRTSFAHQRRIPPGVTGVATLRLDLPALAHSRLADIRLVTGDGFQVPYVLEADDEPLRVPLAPLVAVAAPDLAARLSQRQGRSRTVYEVVFPVAGMPPCDLVLDTNARVFEREVSLLVKNGRRGGRTTGDWETAAWASWRHADPDTPAAPLVLPLPHLPAPGSAPGRLVVDEGDNQALPIGTPTIVLRTYRLRFMRESPAEIWLVYGKAGLTAPQYDLALLDARLRTSDARVVTAEAERPAAGLEADGRSRAVFWGVLIAAVLALLAVVARLLMTQPGR